MARVNVGIYPKYLSDRHLVAESVEITMITGQLKKRDFKIGQDIPKEFKLGKGHITFFKDKLIYLKRRLEFVNAEMKIRGFSPGTKIDLNEFPDYLKNDWYPRLKDSMIIRERIAGRLYNPLKQKEPHKWYRKPIEDVAKFTNNLLESQLFYT